MEHPSQAKARSQGCSDGRNSILMSLHPIEDTDRSRYISVVLVFVQMAPNCTYASVTWFSTQHLSMFIFIFTVA